MNAIAEIIPPSRESTGATRVMSASDMAAVNDDKSLLYFPVEMAPAECEGVVIPNWNVLKRSDTGDHLYIHKESYHLVPNEEVYGQFDNALDEAGLLTGAVDIKDELSHNGLRSFRQYVFKDFTIDPGDGNAVALRLVVFNSYDGSTSFQARIGGYRFVCSNGCITGKDILNISKKHTHGFDIGEIVTKVAKAPALFFEQEEMWRQWRGIEISTEDTIGLFKKMPNASERLVDNLTRRLVETHGGYQSLYDVYNVLTNWATHDHSRTNTPAVQAQREDRVYRLTNSAEWNNRIPAAV